MKIQILALMTGAALLAGCDQGADQGGAGEDVDIQYGTEQYGTTNGTGSAFDQDLTNATGGAFDQEQGMQQGQGASPTTGGSGMQTSPGASGTTQGQSQTGGTQDSQQSQGGSPTTGSGSSSTQTNQGTQQ